MQRVDRSFVPPKATLLARKRMNDAIRAFFDQREFLEVETPIAVVSPGLEPHLEAFETEAIGPDRASERLYLHTSPEYAMKRMLGRGIGSIYQLARVFRNGERSDTHAPEFTMLEWYRAPGALIQLMDDTEALIQHVAEAVGAWRPEGYRRLSVSEAFESQGLPDPLAHPQRADFAKALVDRGLRIAEDDQWEDLFFRAFIERIETAFPPDEVTVLHGYPKSMAALARISEDDPRRAERFEVFIGRLELANAFYELTDAKEQRARFAQDLEHRKASGRAAYPVDEGLLQDLPQIGDAAGIALGVDRLLMRLLQRSAIQDVLCFSPR